jgi:hypothetical protein
MGNHNTKDKDTLLAGTPSSSPQAAFPPQEQQTLISKTYRRRLASSSQSQQQPSSSSSQHQTQTRVPPFGPQRATSLSGPEQPFSPRPSQQRVPPFSEQDLGDFLPSGHELKCRCQDCRADLYSPEGSIKNFVQFVKTPCVRSCHCPRCETRGFPNRLKPRSGGKGCASGDLKRDNRDLYYFLAGAQDM